MIDRVSSQSNGGFSELQASHRFKPVNKPGSVFKQALDREVDSSKPELSAQVAYQPRNNAPVSVQNSYHHMMPMIQEIREIAENNGFIGVTADDVIRAYKSGQSFLADYKV